MMHVVLQMRCEMSTSPRSYKEEVKDLRYLGKTLRLPLHNETLRNRQMVVR
jgi:hypothetical protein